jgi:predicted patatin/cPLA2 family phospholipase
MAARTRKTVELALQGGGAHGAFTWGLLDRMAAVMAAELEVDAHKLHTVLERHLRDHLAELAEIWPNLR